MAKAAEPESTGPGPERPPKKPSISPGQKVPIGNLFHFFSIFSISWILSFLEFLRKDLRWIPLDDPISFHIAVAGLVAINSFVHVLSSVNFGRRHFFEGTLWRFGFCKKQSAHAEICAHFVHMGRIASAPKFQLKAESGLFTEKLEII